MLAWRSTYAQNLLDRNVTYITDFMHSVRAVPNGEKEGKDNERYLEFQYPPGTPGGKAIARYYFKNKDSCYKCEYIYNDMKFMDVLYDVFASDTSLRKLESLSLWLNRAKRYQIALSRIPRTPTFYLAYTKVSEYGLKKLWAGY